VSRQVRTGHLRTLIEKKAANRKNTKVIVLRSDGELRKKCFEGKSWGEIWAGGGGEFETGSYQRWGTHGKKRGMEGRLNTTSGNYGGEKIYSRGRGEQEIDPQRPKARLVEKK